MIYYFKEEIEMKGCTIIHMDIKSKEWKKKIKSLEKQLEERNDPFRHELFHFGYSKNLTKRPERSRK